MLHFRYVLYNKKKGNKDMAISSEKKRVAITMNEQTYEILSELSEKMGISKSAVIAMLLVNEKTKQTSKRK
ncbi:hypothetical protein CIRMBP1286_02484 [Enterococcus cecorum]|nr:hypothetical protein CIRMBP1286_02484 [Enterococcus cecorum]